jgi:DNA helicase-2/ATP-dependent DNA helicase PcrA
MPLDFSKLKLDPEQLAAVTAPDGPVLVFAGAGSGKTRTLTARIAYLIDQGASPYEIMAVTFTKKAAEEMRERCRKLLSNGQSSYRDPLTGLRIGTFHAQMAALLRSLDPDILARVGRTDKFSIWDEDDRAAAIRSIVKEQEIYLPEGITKNDLGERISAWKNDDLVLMAYGGAEGSMLFERTVHPYVPLEKLAASLWPPYEETSRRSDACDFDDLLTLPVYLMGTDKALGHAVSQTIKYLLVDEFQDTNTIQMHLISQLAAVHGNLFVVGDDAQSIYRFRGARIENILRFSDNFPQSTTVVLNTNYRSNQPILDLANQVISESKQNLPKNLRAHNTETATKPILHKFDDEKAEAAYVIEEIKALHERNVSLNDLAILLRVRSQTQPFETAAINAHIRYRILGGVAFWERKEVKDLLAWLRLILNPADEMAFVRAVAKPRRGVGETLLKIILNNAKLRRGNVVEAARAVSVTEHLGSAKSRAGLKEMCDLLTIWSLEEAEKKPYDLIREIIEKSGLRAFHEKAAEAGDSGRAVENLFQVVNAAAHYEAGQLRDMVESIVLEAEAVENDTTDEERERLSIATLHGAKGLEWKGVWLAGFEEDLLPYRRALEEDGGEEEERRLAYVGITRAKNRLSLTTVEQRFLNGNRTTGEPSRFLARAGRFYALADHTTAKNGYARPFGGSRPYGAASGARPFGGSQPSAGAQPYANQPFGGKSHYPPPARPTGAFGQTNRNRPFGKPSGQP